MYTLSSPLWLQEQEIYYGWEGRVELSILISLSESLTQNTQNTMCCFAGLKLKIGNIILYLFPFFQEVYYGVWPMCLAFLH